MRTLQEQFDGTEANRIRLKARIETETLTNDQWSNVANEYAGCVIRCNRLARELRHEASKAAYARSVA